MPQFFFDIRTRDHFLPDETGIELPDRSAVLREIEATIESFRRDKARGGYDYSGARFEVRSADERHLFFAHVPPLDDGASA
jgi:hypothetical protein